MIDCNRFESMVPEAVSGKLAPQLAADFAEHKQRCTHCASFTEEDAYYRIRMQTVGFEPNVPEIDIAAIMNGRSRPNVKHYDFSMRTLALAAGIVLGAFVAGKVLYRSATTPDQQFAHATQPVQQLQAPSNAQQYAGNNTGLMKNKISDSVSLKKSTAPIPEQFPGNMQNVAGK